MKYKIILILSLLLACSCSKDNDFYRDSSNGNKIDFSTYVSNSTRALEKTAFVKDDVISVYAFSHPNVLGEQDFVPNTLKNEALTYDGISSWSYKNAAYWPSNGNMVSFFSIYPSAQPMDFTNGIVSTSLTIDNIAANQIDFMWAGMPNRVFENGDVPFTFRHALSKVEFNAILTNQAANATVTITGVKISGVKKTGKYTLNQDLTGVGAWPVNMLGNPTTVSPLASGETYVVTTEAKQVGASMLLIPQDLSLTANCVEITYDLTYTKEATQPAYSVLDQKIKFTPKVPWVQNTNYIYNLNFSLESVKFSVTEDVIPWDTTAPEEPVIDPDFNDKPNVVSFINHPKGTANSYILNPTAEGGIATHFLIPIAGRINTFWTTYENVTANTITEINTSDLTAEILWEHSEYDESPLELGVGFIDTKGMTSIDQLGLIINVHAGSSGNAIVAVKRGGAVLWSWHLWITDYDPDAIVEANLGKIVDGKYIYTNNGQDAIHRYKDATKETIASAPALDINNHFENGEGKYPWGSIYKNKFMMDRNLGSLTQKISASKKGILYYQYGRKDPFCHHQKGTESGVAQEPGPKPYSFTVQNPRKFITMPAEPNYWCSEADYNGSTYPWNDKAITNDTFTEKSFFDPSPLGWKIPSNGAFSDFTVTGWRPTDFRYNSNIIFLKDGYLLPHNGTQRDYGTVGSYWSSSPVIADFGAYIFDFSYYGAPNINPSLVQPQLASGESVRCILE